METATPEQINSNAAFDQLFYNCLMNGESQQLNDALAHQLEAAFLSIRIPPFSVTNGSEKLQEEMDAVNRGYSMGLSLSSTNSSFGRSIEFNVCRGVKEDNFRGLAAVSPPNGSDYSIIKLVGNDAPTDHTEIAGVYVGRSNKDYEAPLEVIKVFKKDRSWTSNRVTPEEYAAAESYLHATVEALNY